MPCGQTLRTEFGSPPNIGTSNTSNTSNAPDDSTLQASPLGQDPNCKLPQHVSATTAIPQLYHSYTTAIPQLYHSYTTAIPQLPVTCQELRALRQEVRRRFRMGHRGAATTTTVRLLQIVTDRLQIVSSLALCHLPESNGKQQA